MDEQQFDNRLTNRIREVFDNYEYPPAEHGWAELRKKFPAEEKSNKVAWLWWSSAAAIILVALGIGLWYNGFDAGQNNIAVKPAIKPQIKDSVINSTAITQQPTIADVSPTKNKPAYVSPYVRSLGAAPRNAYRPNTARANTVVTQQPITVVNQPENNAAIAQAKNSSAVPVVTAVDSVRSVTPSVQQTQLALANKPADNAVTQPQQNTMAASTVAKQPKATIMDMFEQEKRSQTAQKNTANKQTDKKVTFSVYAATYFNYAEGSSNQVNAGAGVSSDFRLSKKLKLSTGVALAQNSLNYGSASMVPQSRSANALVASAPVLKDESLFAMSAAQPVFRNYNVSMMGIDIPVNIKYEFNPDKTDAFISAGLSSGTFFDESYTYKYTYSNGAVANSAAEDHNETAHSSNNFYFGKMLNFSFGIGYPVGTNRLIVEPFVKYPLGGLGAQDIRFGSGGVNLKFSFKGGKK